MNRTATRALHPGAMYVCVLALVGASMLCACNREEDSARVTPSQSNHDNNSDSAGVGGGHQEDAGGETTPDVLEDSSIDSGDTSFDSGDISLDSGDTSSEVGPDVPTQPCASLHCGMGAECVAEGNEASCVCLEGLEGPSEQGVCIANPLAFLGLPRTLSGRLGQTLYYTPELLVEQGVFPGEPQLAVLEEDCPFEPVMEEGIVSWSCGMAESSCAIVLEAREEIEGVTLTAQGTLHVRCEDRPSGRQITYGALSTVEVDVYSARHFRDNGIVFAGSVGGVRGAFRWDGESVVGLHAEYTPSPVAAFGDEGELWRGRGGLVLTKREGLLEQLKPPGLSYALIYNGEGLVLGDRYIFEAWDEDNGPGFWSTDGTDEGTYLLPLSNTYANIYDLDLVPFAGGLYLPVAGEDERIELWRTDGTRDVSVRVAELDETFGPIVVEPWQGRLLIASKTFLNIYQPGADPELSVVYSEESVPGLGGVPGHLEHVLPGSNAAYLVILGHAFDERVTFGRTDGSVEGTRFFTELTADHYLRPNTRFGLLDDTVVFLSHGGGASYDLHGVSLGEPEPSITVSGLVGRPYLGLEVTDVHDWLIVDGRLCVVAMLDGIYPSFWTGQDLSALEPLPLWQEHEAFSTLSLHMHDELYWARSVRGSHASSWWLGGELPTRLRQHARRTLVGEASLSNRNDWTRHAIATNNEVVFPGRDAIDGEDTLVLMRSDGVVSEQVAVLGESPVHFSVNNLLAVGERAIVVLTSTEQSLSAKTLLVEGAHVERVDETRWLGISRAFAWGSERYFVHEGSLWRLSGNPAVEALEQLLEGDEDPWRWLGGRGDRLFLQREHGVFRYDLRSHELHLILPEAEFSDGAVVIDGERYQDLTPSAEQELIWLYNPSQKRLLTLDADGQLEERFDLERFAATHDGVNPYGGLSCSGKQGLLMSLDASTDEGERRTWVWLSVNGETLHWTFPQESSEQSIPRTLRCVVAGEHVYFEKLDYTDGIEGEAWVHDSLLMAMPLGESELVELLRTPNLDFDEHRRSAIGPWVPWRGGLALVLQGTGAQHKLVMSDGTREGTRVFEGWEQAPLAIEAIVAGDNRLWLDARTRESGEELWVVE